MPPYASSSAGLGQGLLAGFQGYQGARKLASDERARRAQMEKEGQKEALESTYKQAQIDKLNREAEQMGNMPTLGQLDPRFAGSPLAGINDPRLMGIAQGGRAKGEISPTEGQALGRAKYAGGAFKEMGEAFQKLPKVEGAGEMATAFGSRFVPDVVKQREMPEVASYDTSKRMLAERALRIATGAAAPPAEKLEYMFGLLPSYGDTPEIAAKKARQVYSWLHGEAEAAAFAKEAEGNFAAAQAIRSAMQSGMPSPDEVQNYFVGEAVKQQQQPGPLPQGSGAKSYKIISVE